MKSAKAILGIVLIGVATAFAQDPMTPEQAAKNPGERATMEGEVVEISKPENGYIYLNFGGKYPDQTFSAWIHQLETKHFPDIDATLGKRVRVSGVANLLEAKLIIRLRKPEDLTILVSATD